MSERCRSTPEPVKSGSIEDYWRASLAEQVRQFGLPVTTNEEENTTMATANPFDRRGKRRDHHHFDAGDFARGPMMAAPDGLSFTAPRAIAMQDIDAMAASAFTRGELAATDRLERRHAEATRSAQQSAWDEGRQVGEHDGRAALLRAIAEQHEESVRAMHAKGMAVLRRMGDEPDSVDKGELERALDSAVDVLAELIDAHHAGFVPARRS